MAGCRCSAGTGFGCFRPLASNLFLFNSCEGKGKGKGDGAMARVCHGQGMMESTQRQLPGYDILLYRPSSRHSSPPRLTLTVNRRAAAAGLVPKIKEIKNKRFSFFFFWLSATADQTRSDCWMPHEETIFSNLQQQTNLCLLVQLIVLRTSDLSGPVPAAFNWYRA